MVRIVNGEVLQDDDPRLRQHQQQQQSGVTQAPGGAPPPVARNMFDWSAPPLALATDPAGSAFLGLPDVVVYGLCIKAMHYCALAVACLALGWRGFFGGGLLLVLMYHSQANAPPPPPPAGPPGSGTMRLRPRGSGATSGAGQPAAQPGATPAQGNMFSQYLSQPPAGREYRQRLGADNSGDSGEPQRFAGRGQRLGSS
eukprot:jgi/Tetstr1/440938/TSEL_029207.t1